jgi:hypothetical protein
VGGRLMVARIESGSGSFRSLSPQPLFQIRPFGAGPTVSYDVSRDGKKFLILDRPDTAAPITVILNWEARLNKR